jgi:hypothetical protein
MTTRVLVDAHAGWPVKVEAIDKVYDRATSEYTGETQTTETTVVRPNTEQEFYVHDSRQLLITEMAPTEG